MKIHGVQASSMEAGGTREVWTVPGPAALWEFCFGREEEFHFIISSDGHCSL